MPYALTWAPTAPGTRWSVLVRAVDSGADLLALHPDRQLHTASLGKLFALRATARRMYDDPSAGRQALPRPVAHAVADSGLWQHLSAPSLSAADAALLVGAVSDNLAANALIDWVGLAEIQAVARAWVDGGSTLLDYFRDERDEQHPATVSIGSARDYVRIATDISAAAPEPVDVPDATEASAGSAPELGLVREWLGTSVDTSLVAGALGLDPLSHFHPADFDCFNKTGCDATVRADVGVLRAYGTEVAYAAICNWETSNEPDTTHAVLADMQRLGSQIVATMAGAGAGAAAASRPPR